MAASAWDSSLSPEEEKKFTGWKAKYAPADSGDDYDFRGAFKAGLTPGDDEHWPDTYKKPNHPTFSDESVYAKQGNPGHWSGDQFVPGSNTLGGYRAQLAAKNSGVDPYADMSDQDLAEGIHRRYYSDIPFEEYAKKIGITPTAKQIARPDSNPDESPVSRTQRVMDAAHRTLFGASADENAAGHYEPGVVPSIKTGIDETFPTNAELGGAVSGGAQKTAGGLLRGVIDSPVQAADKRADAMNYTADNLEREAKTTGVKNPQIDILRSQADKIRADAYRAKREGEPSWRDTARNTGAQLIESGQQTLRETQPEAPGFVKRNILQGAEAAPALGVAALAGFAAGPEASLAVLGATQYGGTYADIANNKHLSEDEKSTLAMESAGLATVFNAAPVGMALRPGADAVKRFLGSLGVAIPTQEANVVAQQLLLQSKDVAQPLSAEQWAQSAIDTAAQMGLFVGAHAVAGSFRNARRANSIEGHFDEAKQANLMDELRAGVPKVDMPEPEPPAPKQLTGPQAPPDFEVGREGIVRRPGEEVPPQQALPAPQPTGQFEAGPEGVRPLSQNEVNTRTQALEEQQSLGRGNIERFPAPPRTVEPVEKAPKNAAGRRQMYQKKVETLRDAIPELVDQKEVTLKRDGDRYTIYVRNKQAASFGSEVLAQNALDQVRKDIAQQRAGATEATVLGQKIEAPAQPTPAQAEAGNYKKPLVKWNSLDIKVENVKSSTRGGVDAQGKPWSNVMHSDYGYFKGTQSNDGEGVDVFIGPHRGVKTGYVVDQLTPDGLKFDEPKVVIGAKSEDAAKALYLKHYQKGWKGLGAITGMPIEGLKTWLKSGGTTVPISWKPKEEPTRNISDDKSSLTKVASEVAVVKKDRTPQQQTIDERIAKLQETFSTQPVEEPKVAAPTSDLIGEWQHAKHAEAKALVSKTDKGLKVDFGGGDVQEFRGKTAEQKARAQLAKEGFAKPEAPLLKRGGLSEKLTPQTIRAEVDRMLSGFKIKPEVDIYPASKDLPKELVAASNENWSTSDASAVYWRGKIHILANRAGSLASLRETVHHEMIHFAIDALHDSAERKALLDSLTKVNRMETVRRGVEAFGKTIRDTNGKVVSGFDPGKEAHRRVAANEVLAYYGQKYLSGESVPARIKRIVEKWLGQLRDAIRRVFGKLPKFDNLYMKRVINEMMQRLRAGERIPKEAAASTPAPQTVAPVFYSALTRAAETAKIEKGSPSQWLATLKNMQGVKQDEIDWTGLPEWLSKHSGAVTKEQVVEFLHANQIEVQDVLKGSAVSTISPSETVQLRGEADRLTVELTSFGYMPDVDIEGTLFGLDTNDGSGRWYFEDGEWKNDDLEGEVLPARVLEAATQLGEIRDRLTNQTFEDDVPTNATRYNRYALPGGKNYRELLLTLPEYTSTQLGLVEKLKSGKASNSDVEKLDSIYRAPFKSSHWNEPNVLAHVRFDERTDSSGKRVLHIAEIQSDWAQTARKRGFKDDVKPLTADERNELVNVLDRAGADISDLTPAQLVRRAELISRSNAKYDGVPRGPFIGNTESWSTLAMKRMIRWASDNGFDRITWDTGQTNADRYDLSKHISEIHYGRQTITAYDLNGQRVVQRTGVMPEELPDIIGKESADKLMQQPIGEDGRRHLVGQDLQVGHEGMVGFYDKILPATVNKLTKKWGGKVGLANIEVGPKDSAYDDIPGPLVHSLDITPAMRDAAMEGQPLFQRTPDATTPQGAEKADEHRREATADELTDRPATEESAVAGTPNGKGPYEKVRRAVLTIPNSELVMSFRRLIDPVNVSALSKQTAVVGRKAIGELSWGIEHAKEQLEQYSRLFEQLNSKDKLDFMDAIETGKTQPFTALQPAANQMRQMLDGWRKKVQSLGEGYLDNWIENYFPHLWQDEKAAAKVGAAFGRRPLRGPATFLKQRTVPTIKQGIEWGLKPLTLNPLSMTLFKVREMQRFYTGVKLMQELKAKGLARFLPSNQSLPEGWREINDAVGRVRQWSEEEKGFIERGKYIMPEDAARIINNHLSASALRNFAPAQWIRVGSNALNALQLGFSGFHIGFTTLDVLISKNALGIERLVHGEPLQAAKAFGETLLGPVSAGMNIRRGYKLMQAYLNPGGATPELKAQVVGLIAAGGRPRMDAYFLPTQIENPFRGTGPISLAQDIRAALTQPHGKVQAATKALTNFAPLYATKVWQGMMELGKLYPAWQLPFEIAGRIARASTSIIMEHIVPMQKLGVFSDLAADYIRRNPEASPDDFAAAMQKIWVSVDNRLGEMVYDRLFWNRTFKDALHMAFRAVGWNYGTVNEIAGSPGDVMKLIDKKVRGEKVSAEDVGHKIPYVISMTMTTMMIGAMLTYLFTGQGPQEMKDYFFPRTGGKTKRGTPERLSLPSYAKDVYEYAQEPGQTVINKLNPIYSLVHQVWTNEDYFGEGIYDPMGTKLDKGMQIGSFLFEEATPFSFQKGNQMAGAGDGTLQGALKTVLPKIGVNVAPGRVSSPDEVERSRRLREEQAYIHGLTYKMKQARAQGDTKRAEEFAERIRAAKQGMGEQKREVGKDKQKANAAKQESAQKTTSLTPLFNLFDGKVKVDVVQSLRDAGHPALAALFADLPAKPRPTVARALQQVSVGGVA